MFKHKSLGLVIPQYEHLRLAGTISLLWGNNEFDKPPFHESFINGVALHDFGFGEMDSYSLGDMSADDRFTSLEKLVSQNLDDPISDLVAQFHVLRLIGDTESNVVLRKSCLAKIEDALNKVDITREDFMWADKITDFCDSVSFDFCFGENGSDSIDVYRKLEDTHTTELEYTIDENRITINPWPLSVNSYSGYIVGYQSDGYPTDLKPSVIKYVLQSQR